jgi:hypothetical protein
MRKAIFLSLFALSVVVLLAGQAAATVCTNANKKDGAGNVGDVFVSFDGTILFPTNRGGQLAGGFVDVFVQFVPAGPFVKVANDVFILDIKHALAAGEFPELPHGAHQAAGCGKGVDDLEDPVCYPPPP